MHVFDKFIYLHVAFATDIEKIVFLTFADSAKSGKFHESGHEFQEGGSTHRAWTAFLLSSD